jgi:hypothetical protein
MSFILNYVFKLRRTQTFLLMVVGHVNIRKIKEMKFMFNMVVFYGFFLFYRSTNGEHNL